MQVAYSSRLSTTVVTQYKTESPRASEQQQMSAEGHAALQAVVPGVWAKSAIVNEAPV